MKFKDYLLAINKLATENPELLEVDVYYASDDEGNSYDLVGFKPTFGVISEGCFGGDYTQPEDFKECGYNKSNINAVVIN